MNYFIFIHKDKMSRFIAICDASFCPTNKFAYAGYRVLQFTNYSLLVSNIWKVHPSNSTQAEKFALLHMINYLDSAKILKHSTLYCDHLDLVRQMQKNGLFIRHIEGHKSPKKRDWVDWEFSKLDQELRKILRENRKMEIENNRQFQQQV